jgi:uncharacterized OsmC-like protein
MDLRATQKPLKDRYREEADAAKITLSARGGQTDTPITCNVDLGRALYEAQAHEGVGGPGTGACSGDLLLGALAACAQVTAQMVAANMGIEVDRLEVVVEGDLDLRGTLGVDRDVSPGFEAIRLRFEIDAPNATEEELASLHEKAERYCTVLQTILRPPEITTSRS